MSCIRNPDYFGNDVGNNFFMLETRVFYSFRVSNFEIIEQGYALPQRSCNENLLINIIVILARLFFNVH